MDEWLYRTVVLSGFNQSSLSQPVVNWVVSDSKKGPVDINLYLGQVAAR